jgi:hypothetical protein
MIAKWRRRPWSDRLLFLEAVFWLGIARLATLLFPFKRIAPLLGEHQSPEGGIKPVPPTHPNVLEQQIGWAIQAAAKRTPWQSLCLAQAMAGKKMLQRRRRRSTLFLGVAKDPEKDGLQAHAWLQCGQGIITGGEESPRFVVISAFTDKGTD